MRSNFSMSRFMAEMDRERYPEQYEAARVAAAAVFVAPVDPLSLTPMQQAALLTMTVSQVKNALIGKLLEDSQTRPSGPDYAPLRTLGHAEYKQGKRLHDLTPVGIVAAKQLETMLCQRFDIHMLIECGPVGWQQKYRCTCGQSYFVRRSPTAPGNARRQWAADHATRDGITRLVNALKPPQRAEG